MWTLTNDQEEHHSLDTLRGAKRPVREMHGDTPLPHGRQVVRIRYEDGQAADTYTLIAEMNGDATDLKVEDSDIDYVNATTIASSSCPSCWQTNTTRTI